MVSFIIPVYNGEKYIKRCISSIINSIKSNSDYEIIVVNDGSKDATKEIIEEIKTNSKAVKTIHQKNAGVSLAREKGIQAASGEWIVFVDADDIVTNDIVSIISEYGSRADWLVFSGNVKDVNVLDSSQLEVKEKILMAILNQSEDPVLKNIHLNTVWSKAYRKDLIKKNSIVFETKVYHGEDMLYNIDYMKNCKSVYCIGISVYTLCANNMSATQRFHKNCVQNDMLFLNQLELRNICGDSVEMLEAFQRIALNGIWISMGQYFAHLDNKKSRHTKIVELAEFLNTEPYRMSIKHCSIERNTIRRIIFNMLNFHMYSLVLNFMIIMRKQKKSEQGNMKEI